MINENERIETNNKAFQKRLRKFHRSEAGRALREQLKQIHSELFGVYRNIAMSHWAENGNDASTGWGCVPEGKYQKPRKPEHCAEELANKLVDAMVSDPDYALGAK